MEAEKGIDIFSFLVTRPDVIWSLALMGAVCVIGVVDFCKCWTKGKKKYTKWIVLFVSLGIGVTLSPVTPPFIATIVIISLLVLALAVLGNEKLLEGIPNKIGKMMGTQNKEKEGDK